MHSESKALARFFRMATVMGVGRAGSGGPRPPWILKISAKKGCFLGVEKEKTNFTTFGPHQMTTVHF